MANGRIIGPDRVDTFFQKFGDHNGNGVVDLLDFAALRSTFGKSADDVGFLEHLDANGNSTIDLIDFAAFRGTFGQ